MSTLDPSQADALAHFGVIPVVQFAGVPDALKVAEALIAGGLPVMEVTFRTDAAAPAIAAIRERYPSMLVGAGTLLTPRQVGLAVSVGAHFGVSPGLNLPTLAEADSLSLGFIPGAVTASEVETALGLGITLLKLFPAEVVGGTRLLDAFGGPYPDVKFMPTGGVNSANLGDYLSRRNVDLCGGTWIAPPELIAAGEFEQIAERADLAAQVVHASHLNRTTEGNTP